jgi:SNF2 family DNA or RNA helicase
LGYLKYYRELPGPHLVLVPKSTLQNWVNEFNRWIPEFKVLLFHGSKDERAALVQSRLLTNDWEICISSYEICMLEKAQLRKIAWGYIVIDEAHRIKNENSLLSQIVRTFSCRNRLLLTGTPLQVDSSILSITCRSISSSYCTKSYYVFSSSSFLSFIHNF